MSTRAAAPVLDGAAGLAHEAAVLAMAAIGVVLLFVAKGWNFPGLRGVIKFKTSWHGRRIAYSLAAVVFGIAAVLHFAPRLSLEAEHAWPGVIVGACAITGGTIGLSWSAGERLRRRLWAGAAVAITMILLGSVAGALLDALGSGVRATGDALGRAGSATAQGWSWVLGAVVLLGVTGLLAYWMVDRAASRDQMFKRAGIVVLAAAALLGALMLTGVVAPEQLAGNGGRQ